MHVLFAANLDVMKEVTKMMTTMELREVFREIGFDEEWEEKVREEGRKEALRETARLRLADGMDPALIVQFTGLPAAEIEALRTPR
jgi:hypothetical protein